MPTKGTYQIVGTPEKKVSHGNRPVTSPSSNPKSGQFQMVGTQQAIGRTPVHSPSANPPSGQFQIIGTEKPMSRAAVKGWPQPPGTPMSPVAVDASNNAAQRGGKRK